MQEENKTLEIAQTHQTEVLLQSHIEKLEARLSTLSEEERILKGNLSKMENIKLDLTQEIERIESVKGELKTDLEKIETDYKENCVTLEQKLEILKNKHFNTEKETKVEISKAKEEISSLITQKMSLESDIQVLQASAENLNRMQAGYIEFSAEVESKINEKNEEIKYLDEQIIVSKTKSDEAIKSKKVLEKDEAEARNKVKQVEIELNEKMKSLVALSNKQKMIDEKETFIKLKYSEIGVPYEGATKEEVKTVKKTKSK